MAQHRPLGIRTTQARVEIVDASARTLHGTYWFDLRTRHPVAARIKRGLDIVSSSILLVLLAPLLLLLMALIKLMSEGPALFRQRRIGFRCNEFGMAKLRTMYTGAELLEAELGAGVDSHGLPLARFLRRFHLDELPALLNVLEGTMSLVGPRPLLPADLETFSLRAQMRRFSMVPGITGLWQVSGRGDTTDQERMRLDREYINEWSLWLDLKILLRTAAVVLTGKGAK